MYSDLIIRSLPHLQQQTAQGDRKLLNTPVKHGSHKRQKANGRWKKDTTNRKHDGLIYVHRSRLKEKDK